MSTSVVDLESPPTVAQLRKEPSSSQPDTTPIRVTTVISVAHFHGVSLDSQDFPSTSQEAVPSPASLASWLKEHGFWAKATRLRWRQLLRVEETAPIVLLLRDGGACLVSKADTAGNVVFLQSSMAPGSSPVAVDEMRLAKVWDGEALLVRPVRGVAVEDEPFSIAWLGKLVMHERRILRDITVASLTLSVLQVLPPLIVMVAIDKVIAHRNMSTLVLLITIFSITALYEAFLGFGRREIVQVLSTRLDTRLNLHIFSRLLSLPLDYFERTATGDTTYKLSQVFKIREFLTGKLVNTFLELFTLVILLPFLFWTSATLAWMVVVASCLVALVILGFLPAIRHAWSKMIAAETKKGAVLVETVHGIRTIKSLSLEGNRKREWDERIAEVGHARLESGRIANWAQTFVNPIESFVNRGVLLVGIYIITASPAGTSGITTGGVIAFMMLGGRIAGPLIGIAKLIEDMEDVRSSVSQVAQVLNNPTEAAATRGGLRPKFQGAISFDELTFTYPGAKGTALDRLSFQVPAGTMLGVVGRSGSGKSTITRLLQGLNREYGGYLKIDGTDLREINLTHLRRSFGVVMQDNFLFRGTIRDNIIAGRPGLTLEDALRAARMAGAEEFIERLPQGYETWIEEGSSNLSGGQRQRLAIARALVADPRLMILDEATSALDPESEALVNANLLRIGKGRTMVIVSHRLSSLVDCDQILVMDKGRAVDIGPHKALLERCTIYRQLWNQQHRHMEASSGRETMLKTVL